MTCSAEGTCTKRDILTGKPVHIFMTTYKKEHKVRSLCFATICNRLHSCSLKEYYILWHRSSTKTQCEYSVKTLTTLLVVEGLSSTWPPHLGYCKCQNNHSSVVLYLSMIHFCQVGGPDQSPTTPNGMRMNWCEVGDLCGVSIQGKFIEE